MTLDNVNADPPVHGRSDLILRFYATNDAYGIFSNFSKHPITMDGRQWPTSEHAFQALKFAGNLEHEEQIRAAKTPFAAAQMGRDRARPIRSDWATVRDVIMGKVLEIKFSQHVEIRDVLLSTTGATLVEDTANDSYWGNGGDGSGLNRLGRLLMDLRDQLMRPGQATFLLPPWTRWPTEEHGSMVRGTGAGASYLLEWQEWRKSLSHLALAHYDQYFPPPRNTGWDLD